jgi:hypothetical protein
VGVLNDAVEDLPQSFEDLPTDLPRAAKDQGESDVEEARERRRSASDANDRDGMDERRQVVECRGWEDRARSCLEDEKTPTWKG